MTSIDWRSWRRPSRWDAVPCWALDLETSGLNPATDAILAVGMVPIRDGRIRYGERFSSLVRPPAGLALSTEGIGAHHLMPSDLEAAPLLAAVVDEVAARLAEGPLVVHHAPIDVTFLRAAWRGLGRRWPRPVVIDTQRLLVRWHHRRHRFRPHPPPPRIGLAHARAELGLPPHAQHDALADALATAELLLVLRDRLRVTTLRGLR